ncbi:MAG: hypothetical protein P8L66_11060 [Rhodospirillaceae bacterium]|nr:hypothetical protein [Rhodospirillaceae bacterium]
MSCFRRAIAAWTLVFTIVLGTSVTEPLAQDSTVSMATPDWGDTPLLMSQFGELCTMCEAYVRCSAEQPAASNPPRFTLFYFETKTFWGQIATIWDYFAKWFDPVTSEKRPATVFKFITTGPPNITAPVTAYLSVADATIDIDGTRIDRNTLAWMADGGDTIGSCRRLGIPESMAMIEANSPWETVLKVQDTPDE